MFRCFCSNLEKDSIDELGKVYDLLIVRIQKLEKKIDFIYKELSRNINNILEEFNSQNHTTIRKKEACCNIKYNGKACEICCETGKSANCGKNEWNDQLTCRCLEE